MKALKVQYTVKPDYADTNKRNIRKVMADLQKIANPGIKYYAFLLDDGKTFFHFGIYSDQAALDMVNNLPSFQFFRDQLKTSEPDTPPQGDDLSLVDSSFEIF
jgi:quinol monooxygenase YgiN